MVLFIIGFIVSIIILLIIAIFVNYNTFIKLKNQIEEAYSTMDIYLKKRYDLIPNLVEIVKQYAKHESETLKQVVEARNAAISSTSLEEIGANENALSGAITSLFAISESYPKLKADTNFLNLQNQLLAIEEDISEARRYYNGVVKVMNNKVETFPSNIFAGILGFVKYPFFEVSDFERDSVEIKF